MIGIAITLLSELGVDGLLREWRRATMVGEYLNAAWRIP